MAIRLADLPPVLVRNYTARVNTFLRGKPGIGKTETILAFGEKMTEKVQGFKVWTFYAPTMSPMDIQASAPDYDTGKLRLFNNQALPNVYDEGGADLCGVIFFGELPNADPATAKLLQKYINGEDMSGTLRKPEGVVVIADGNRLEDKSSVQQQGRAFLSRFESFEVYSDPQDNIAFAGRKGWHHSVQLFFHEHPELIDNYDEVFETTASASRREKKSAVSDRMSEEGKLGIWANMRSWDRISRKEFAADALGSPITIAELEGSLGAGVASAYLAHKSLLSKLASFDDIVKDPEGVVIPEKPDERFALMMLVALRIKDTQMDVAAKFGKRLPLDMQAAMLRTMANRKGFDLVSSDHYTKWISNSELVAMINGR